MNKTLAASTPPQAGASRAKPRHARQVKFDLVVTIQNCLIGYICLWTILPWFAYGNIYRILVLLCVGGWIILELLRRDNIIQRFSLSVFLAIAYILYTNTMSYFFYGMPGIIISLQVSIMLFFLFVLQSRRSNLRSLAPVLWLVLAAMPVGMAATLQELSSGNAHAARLAVRSSIEAEDLAAQGVGGYSLVYGALLMLPGLLGLVANGLKLDPSLLPRPLRRYPSVAKILVVLNVALASMLIVMAGYSIAVIGLFVCVICITTVKSRSTIRIVLAIFLALLVTLFYKPTLSFALRQIQPLTAGTSYSVKVTDVLRSLEQGDATGTAALRSERYRRSALLFVENPVTGVLRFEDIGKHSEILDSYGRWGILWGSVFLYLVAFVPYRALRSMRRNFGAALSMIAVTLIVTGLNRAFGAAGVMVFLVFPLLQVILADTRRRRQILDRQRRATDLPVLRPRSSP